MRSTMAIIAALYLCQVHAQSLRAVPPASRTVLEPVHPSVHRMMLPVQWDYNARGVFCKLDVLLERRARFPVLLRLGDVKQVEAWEGKGPLRLAGPVHR